MGKIAVFTYGRFQPPHIKHGELIQTVIQKANEIGGTPFIFTSQKHNNFTNEEKAKKYMKSKSYKTWSDSDFRPELFESTLLNENPLKPGYKVILLQYLYGNLFQNYEKPCCIVEDQVTNPLSAMYYLTDRGFDKIIMIVGKDREEGFKKAFEKYDHVEIHGIDRPEKSYSGTRLRKMAISGDKEALNKAMGNKFNEQQLDYLIHEINSGVRVPNHIQSKLESTLSNSKTKTKTKTLKSKPKTMKQKTHGGKNKKYKTKKNKKSKSNIMN